MLGSPAHGWASPAPQPMCHAVGLSLSPQLQVACGPPVRPCSRAGPCIETIPSLHVSPHGQQDPTLGWSGSLGGGGITRQAASAPCAGCCGSGAGEGHRPNTEGPDPLHTPGGRDGTEVGPRLGAVGFTARCPLQALPALLGLCLWHPLPFHLAHARSQKASGMALQCSTVALRHAPPCVCHPFPACPQQSLHSGSHQ